MLCFTLEKNVNTTEQLCSVYAGDLPHFILHFNLNRNFKNI